ncbi:MAG: 4Fe-4S single cluster domain-containing protein [Bacillota bacterium]
MNLRLAGLQTDSIVDGPGIRLAIYLQGCPHHCPGCHNPETHDPAGGWDLDAVELLEIVDRHTRGDGSFTIDGVTVSGGEPFEQAGALALLAKKISARGLNLIFYSGYTFEQLLQCSRTDRNIKYLLEVGWLLIDGPYIQEQKDLSLSYRGSRNQRLIDLARSLKAGTAVEWSGGCELSEEGWVAG